ncbi:NAD(P)-dependent dehydrogenase (short-subunit alcohol dehydrogenase family) [Thermocatellispora tengchongensis]|uniref:NAD(P)-dependent dehydrogenase (Short-subunit alcohol dehydrogenase family) n=1 Tax=Thermocatellispora tengchongensis TaxID=1073253 RepID=A0A840P301_9ACTN|nr:SDR family NAD(P)-dependent oxidoreductase [Thermocatellispora tengchongensis]MBB5132251.1 NAD(P)-dependent dehydrogenase (short-subunit alcohol dehydrogenase family) [Thermocatellispora tengchongensis]
MDVNGASVLVTGGASGLGAATAERLAGLGAHVVILDLPESPGEAVAGKLGARFAPADVTDPAGVEAALDLAERAAPLRALVHCAGRGGPVRLVDRDGNPGSLETYERIVRVNLIGTFNVLRLAAARMARNEEVEGERGVCVLTASVAAWEGQIGQIPYASAKAGVVGMTLVAARDLASKKIRVTTIAPGLFDTPILARLPEEVRESLGRSVPHPNRLGAPEEYAALAQQIIENRMLNGETIRLDGALRMAPR